MTSARVRDVLLAVCLAVAGCGGKAANQCGRAASVEDAGPGACVAANALLSCVTPAGTDCRCLSDNGSCPGCGPETRAICHDECLPTEYAARCGDGPTADASFVVVYDDPPPGCRLIGLGNGLASAYCCPCQ
jgi:hypothetical protein